MGYLTTLTIRNDYLQRIVDNPRTVIDAIHQHCAGGRETCTVDARTGQRMKYGGGEIQMFQPRHADETMLYVHYGNTVTEFRPYRDDFGTSFDKSLIKEIEQLLKIAKKKIKENESK